MSIRKTTMRAGAGLAAVALIAAPAPALAHDTMTGSSPEAGATSAEAPSEVELSFSAQPQDVGLEIRVSGPDGSDVTDGEPRIEGSAAVQELSETAQEPGEYSVVWRVVSSDGHPIEGAYDYTVEGDGAASAPAAEEASSDASEDAPESHEHTSGSASSAASQDSASAAAADEAASEDDDEDQGPGTAVWLLVGGGIVVLGAVAAAVVMMRRMSR